MPVVVAAVAAASVGRSKMKIAATAAVVAAVAAAVAAAAAVVPAPLHRAGWEAETCWPRVRPRRPRCCRTSKRDRASRAPAAGCYVERCRGPERTPRSGVRRQVRTRPGWEAATRRLC